VVVGGPGGGVAFDIVGGFEVLAFDAQPAGQLIPVAQQAFQRHLHDHLPFAFVTHQQPVFHQRIDQRAAVGGQISLACHSPHRLIVVGVDGGQPGNKRRTQELQRGLALLGGRARESGRSRC
jgi:hypothetical protein